MLKVDSLNGEFSQRLLDRFGFGGGGVSIYTAYKFPGQKDFATAKNFHVFSTLWLLKPEYMALAGKSPRNMVKIKWLEIT